MYSAIARNKRNTVVIVLIFLLIVGALGFAASALWNSPSIGFVVLVGAAVYALIQYFAAGRQALSMSGAQEVDVAPAGQAPAGALPGGTHPVCSTGPGARVPGAPRRRPSRRGGPPRG